MLSEANMILTSCECRGTLWKLLASASSPPPPLPEDPQQCERADGISWLPTLNLRPPQLPGQAWLICILQKPSSYLFKIA